MFSPCSYCSSLASRPEARDEQRFFKSAKIWWMEIKIVKDPITRTELEEVARAWSFNLVKAVVDVEKEIMAVGGELHADEEALLIEEEGSNREYTWGVNLYPDKEGEDWIELDSVINLKPAFGNRSRSVENIEAQNKIREVIKKLVQ